MRSSQKVMFQFYLSSIKRGKYLQTLCKKIEFQFYLSSIKSWFDRATNTLQISFNSTLVQLKE